MMFYLKLRNNIVLDSDLQLAEKEIKNLFLNMSAISSSVVKGIPCPADCIASHTRKAGIIGYLVDGIKVDILHAVKLLSFIQEVWLEDNGDAPITDYCLRKEGYICYIPLLAMSEFLYYSRKPRISTITEILNTIANVSKKNSVVDHLTTSAPHLHSFHTYKAKFFPRFVHSLIVSNYNPSLQEISICDPFLGSGTTLIEGALIGHQTCGIDIDPLSCFISNVKAKSLFICPSETVLPPQIGLFDITKKVHLRYEFPNSIKRKFVRGNMLPEMYQYEEEISMELSVIENEIEPLKTLHKIALSDALTKKFNIRMMGTGSGRFALEIGKTSLKSLIESNITNELKAIQTIDLLKQIYKLNVPQPIVVNGSATKRNFQDNSFDIIVTSPPYIPASSGREDYLVGKLISLKAMGLYNEDCYTQVAENSVGSMYSLSLTELNGLPDSVQELYNWLINDKLRYVKAKPIVSYYQSIKQSLEEDKRTIKTGGKIIYIIGKETVFYSSSTKEILYKVACDEIFVKIAKSIGLKVEEKIYIELDKKIKIARPRGSDKYYECAIIMSK